MSSTPRSQRYDRVSIALHWTIGLAIIALAVSALLREPLFAKGSFPREALKAFHEPAGMVVFVLIALRLLWRAAHRAPALPDTMTGPERGLAHATHVVLYLLMIAIPLVGAVFVLGRGRPIDFGLFQIASPFAAAPFARESLRTLKELHELLGKAILALALLHAGAAIWHHHVRRDDVLTRMLPQKS